MQLRVPTPAEHERAGLAYATRQQVAGNIQPNLVDFGAGVRD